MITLRYWHGWNKSLEEKIEELFPDALEPLADQVHATTLHVTVGEFVERYPGNILIMNDDNGHVTVCITHFTNFNQR